MPTQTLSIVYKKNNDLVFSPSELKSKYFFGVPLVDTDGNTMSDDDVRYYIGVAQREIEDYLSIKLKKQAYKESGDFSMDDWWSWGYVPTTYPVKKPITLQGFLNTTLQIDYPIDWLSSKKASDELYHRAINLVPITGSPNTLAGNIIYNGIAPNLSYFGNKQIPNYWEFIYITGFDNIPLDILDVIGKKAAFGILNVLGDLGPAGPATANASVSIDGLSTSLGTTASATSALFTARIQQYQKELDKQLPLLYHKYKGIAGVFGVL